MTVFTPQQTPLTAFGESLAVPNTNKITLRFDYAVNARQTEQTVSGSGAISHSGTFAIASTGTTTGSVAELRSRDLLKYNNGQGLDVRFTAIFDTPVANTIQLIGTGNTTDGWALGYSGTTFGFFRYKGGVQNFTALASFNVDPLDGSGPSGMTITQTNLNVFRITAQYLGGGAQYAYVESDINNPGQFTLVNRVDFTNANTDTSINNPTLPVYMRVDNGSTTTNMQIKSASFSGQIQGIENFVGVSQGVRGSATGVTTERNILTIRNKSTNVLGGTNTNRTPIILDYLSISSDGPKILQVNGYLGGSVAGASFSSVSNTTSVMEYDTTNGAITTGYNIFPFDLGSAANMLPIVRPFQQILYPGEAIVFTAQSIGGGGAGNDVSISARWTELF